MVLWYCGIVVLWYCGIVVLWYCGIVVLWYCGIVWGLEGCGFGRHEARGSLLLKPSVRCKGMPHVGRVFVVQFAWFMLMQDTPPLMMSCKGTM